MNKIMILEDDENIRNNLIELLSNKGYAVSGAKNVKEAKEQIDNASFDLYLLDVILPDGDGFEVCEYIRMIKTEPIIFLTSVDDEASIEKGLNIGGDDYVVKPFRMSELNARILANLRRAQLNDKVSDDTYTFPDNLTAIERELMEIFVANKGLILKRETLLERLWDDKGNFVEDNTLTVVISRMKNKITKGKIETIRGIGYRFEV
ncbi:MAG: response regulator transcription factor [Lachnospiraceae bacterium]|nr:response regulator transcription factor [Lachnospira sp.]MBR6698298.1 response regulator transcription factor [Lachnospiraceae bacterium]